MEIELPDGTVLDAPDDADVKTVVQNYQRNRTQQAARDTFADMSTGDRLAVGFARPFVELGLGVKDLTTGLTDEDRANLERLQQVSGGAGTVGRVAGEIATFAAPGGAVSKGAAKVAPLLPRALARLAPVAADMASAAGVEALKAPTADTSRGERAVGGVVGAGVGHAVGAVAAPLVRGLDPTAAGQAMIDRGIPLTPGMAKGGWMQALEERLASIPGFSGAIRNRQRETIQAWNRDLLQRATPDAEISAAGHQGFREATAAFKAAYEKLWARDLDLNVPVLSSFWQSTVERARQNLAPESADSVANTLRRLMGNKLSAATNDGSTVLGPTVSQVDDILRGEAMQAARRGDGAVAGYYKDARAQLKGLLPDDFRKEWESLDGLYSQFATMRRAAGYKGAATQEGVFTPNQLLSASVAADKSVGKGGVARGTAPLQQEATQALRVMGNNLPGQALGTAEKLTLPLVGAAAPMDPTTTAAVYGAGRAAYSPWMRDWMTSPHTVTRAMIEALRKRGVTAGTVGAAVEDR